MWKKQKKNSLSPMHERNIKKRISQGVTQMECKSSRKRFVEGESNMQCKSKSRILQSESHIHSKRINRRIPKCTSLMNWLKKGTNLVINWFLKIVNMCRYLLFWFIWRNIFKGETLFSRTAGLFDLLISCFVCVLSEKQVCTSSMPFHLNLQ